MERIAFTKADAVRRQLMIAVDLFFQDGDVLAIHTLASAALRITQDVCDGDHSLPDSLLSSFSDLIKPEFKSEYWGGLRGTANFLKHADRDPDAVHEFSPEQTETILFMACDEFKKMTTERYPKLETYQAWFILHYPESFQQPQLTAEQRRPLEENREKLLELNRMRFLQEVLPHFVENPIERGDI